MTQKPWRGNFAIPMTPFDENDAIDVDVLAAEIEFCIECPASAALPPRLWSASSRTSQRRSVS